MDEIEGDLETTATTTFEGGRGLVAVETEGSGLGVRGRLTRRRGRVVKEVDGTHHSLLKVRNQCCDLIGFGEVVTVETDSSSVQLADCGGEVNIGDIVTVASTTV